MEAIAPILSSVLVASDTYDLDTPAIPVMQYVWMFFLSKWGGGGKVISTEKVIILTTVSRLLCQFVQCQ